MCDGLPVLVELVQYPPELDGAAGNRLANLLSEVASAVPLSVDRGSELLKLLESKLFDIQCAADEAGEAWIASHGPSNQFHFEVATLRAHAVQLAATTVELIEFLDIKLASRWRAAVDTEAEVLRWLRQTIGEQLGRVGEHAIASINPRAHLSRLLSENGIASVEPTIVSRWGVTIIIGTGDTVAATAAAIVTALHRQSQSTQETSHAQG